MSKINIFCLPFAGGSRYSYNGLREHAPLHVNIAPIELPGRGFRSSEPLLDNLSDMVSDLFEQIRGRLHEPYALYGHSMGALLANLLTKRIAAGGWPIPLHLFVSGLEAPAVGRKASRINHLLPRNAFIAALRELGGCPEDVLQDELLMEYYEPIIRADLRALAGYEYRALPLDVPVHVMFGDKEGLSWPEILGWQQESTEQLSVTEFGGDHFFIFNYEKEIVRLMCDSLGPIARPPVPLVYEAIAC